MWYENTKFRVVSKYQVPCEQFVLVFMSFEHNDKSLQKLRNTDLVVECLSSFAAFCSLKFDSQNIGPGHVAECSRLCAQPLPKNGLGLGFCECIAQNTVASCIRLYRGHSVTGVRSTLGGVRV